MRRCNIRIILEEKPDETVLSEIYEYIMSAKREHVCCEYSETVQFEAIKKRLENLKSDFSDCLVALIDQKHMKDRDVYFRAGLTKQTFNKIKNKKVLPKKETAMSLCIGAGLSIEEANELLNRAGYSFSESSEEDMVFKYFIEKGIYNIFEVYSALYHFGIKKDA